MSGSADALAITNFASTNPNLTVVLTNDAREAENYHEALNFYLADQSILPILLFPGWESLPYDAFSPHPDIVSDRIKILCKLPFSGQGILIVSADNAMQKLPPVDYMTTNSVALDVGQTLDPENFRQQLEEISYQSVDLVQAPGEYVYRGGIIDLFPMGSEDPIRIELFGDEVDTLRYFSVDDQLTIRKINKVRILPGREIPIERWSVDKFRQKFRETFTSDPRENEIYSQINTEVAPNGVEFYLPLFFDSTSSIFDYIPQNANFFLAENFETSTKDFWNYVHERYEGAKQNAARLPLAPENLYCSPSIVEQYINKVHCIHLDNSTAKPDRTFKIDSNEKKLTQGHRRSFESVLRLSLKPMSYRTLITLDDFGQREIVETALSSLELDYSRVEDWNEFLQSSSKIATTIAHLHTGFTSPTEKVRILTSGDLLGYRGQIKKHTKRTRNLEGFISSMQELKVGEPVVHEQYGIGLYQGLVTMLVTEQPSEFIKIKYSGEENLYVSVHNVDYISRYTGGNSDEVELNSLSSRRWDNAKRKARQQAYDVAAELIAVQSLRDTRPGNRMPLPMREYQEFVSRFQYSETADQKQAIDSVLSDLEANRPMDRLVCGDVGFGKTEVALRAALVSAMNGFQVAVVVPTRPLANQHYDVFLDRFSETGVQIELLSGMRSKSATERVLSGLKSGSIDIAIGTHSLLQESVKFANLGLVIIDEEHRFGVRQKESLKRLRAEVDILTLTATPIPRTLSMALRRIRDISIIATPPENRLSVRTFVKSWRPQLVREACMRELRRGGQIFYVHNEVRTIEAVTAEISRIVPEAKIEFAHGQMHKAQLDRVMKDFYVRKFDLLVCTTIIESGIDIATANTIIIDKAYRFGLAQLHQLRGRVGRSHHQAYAYLLVPSRESLRSDAKRRLEAIEAFDDLGVGYIIATHDLEIRGAGALLGDEQSGAVHDIGYSIYTKYLNEAVSARSDPAAAQSFDEQFSSSKRDVDIDLQVPALIPDNWIQNVNQRLVLYRKIAMAEDENNLTTLKHEMLDRFGIFPEEVNNLYAVRSIKMKSLDLGLKKLNIQARTGRVVFGNDHKVDVHAIRKLIADYPGTVRRIDAEATLEFTHRLKSNEGRIERAHLILKTLAYVPEHSVEMSPTT